MNFLNFSFNFVVDAKGLARGLCLMWKAGFTIKLVDFNKDLIAVNILDTTCTWNLVGFYGLPLCSQEKEGMGKSSYLLSMPVALFR